MPNPVQQFSFKPLRKVKTALADERALLAKYLALKISLDELFAGAFSACNRYLPIRRIDLRLKMFAEPIENIRVPKL